MAPGNHGSEIVRTFTPRDCPTGDYYVQTVDGRWWRHYAGGDPLPLGTGETQGIRRGNKIEVKW